MENSRMFSQKKRGYGNGVLIFLVAILNGKSSNYDSDLFVPIINKIQVLCNVDYNYEGGTPHRVIADHLRMLAFSIADGAMPGNDGRGYVLRRVLRRASRYGKML